MAKKKTKKKAKKAKKAKKNIFTKKTVITVDYSDLEKFIKEKTGRALHIPELLEASNDSEHEVSVSKDDSEFDFEREKQEAAENFLFEGGKEPDYMFMHNVMNALCKRDIVEAGDYLIRVSW
jgi:hypothetical protein